MRLLKFNARPWMRVAAAFLLAQVVPFATAAGASCLESTQTHLCLAFSSGTQVNDDLTGLKAGVENTGDLRAKGNSLTGGTATLAALQIEYEGGTDVERSAKVVVDPAAPSKKVLTFALKSPNVRNKDGKLYKARIQGNLYGNRNVRELRERVNLRLDDGFRTLREYPDKFGWLTISEWWNNAAWSNLAYPFRISVNIVKTERYPGAPLRLAVHSQTFDPSSRKWKTIWNQVNDTFELPVDQWLALDYRYVEGDAYSGRFFLAVTPEGGSPITIFNIRNATHHPDDPTPDGLGHFNPMKLYTSRQLVEFVRDRGSSLRAYWSDLDLRACSGNDQSVTTNVATNDWLPCAGK